MVKVARSHPFCFGLSALGALGEMVVGSTAVAMSRARRVPEQPLPTLRVPMNRIDFPIDFVNIVSWAFQRLFTRFDWSSKLHMPISPMPTACFRTRGGAGYCDQKDNRRKFSRRTRTSNAADPCGSVNYRQKSDSSWPLYGQWLVCRTGRRRMM